MQPKIYHQNSYSFYPSELFTLDHFTMRHPVQLVTTLRFSLLSCKILKVDKKLRFFVANNMRQEWKINGKQANFFF